MAQKKKAKANSDSTVVRIKASDDTKPAAITKQPTKRVASKDEPKSEKANKIKKPSAKGIARPFVAIGSYFKGAWTELKQVRWPTRRATWSLTFAVIVYSAFFVLIVLLLDALFKYLFELILGK